MEKAEQCGWGATSECEGRPVATVTYRLAGVQMFTEMPICKEHIGIVVEATSNTPGATAEEAEMHIRWWADRDPNPNVGACRNCGRPITVRGNGRHVHLRPNGRPSNVGCYAASYDWKGGWDAALSRTWNARPMRPSDKGPLVPPADVAEGGGEGGTPAG